MPKRNIRGGKGFKKGRKDGGADKSLTAKFEGKEAGQQYGRVITVLGNRRFKCFCDDGQERICKLRGLLCWGPRRQRVEIGDIVLISERSFDGGEDSDTEVAAVPTVSSTRVDISDIITKIPQHFWRDIRRAGGIHPDFFGGLSLADAAGPKKRRDDDIFDGSDGGDGDDDDDDVDGNVIQHKRAPKWSATAVIESDNEEVDVNIDIDAI